VTIRKGEEISPALVQLVENNLLLQQAIADLKHIKGLQEMNHILAVQLRDHATIERVDKLWLTVNNGRWLLGAIATVLGALLASHVIWKIP
jgi:hypothetical protein